MEKAEIKIEVGQNLRKLKKRKMIRKRNKIRRLYRLILRTSLLVIIAMIISILNMVIVNLASMPERINVNLTVDKPKINENEISTEETSAPTIIPNTNPAIPLSYTTYNIELEKIIESEELSAELQHFAYNLCKENDFPFEIFMAIMQKESTYNPDAISADGKDQGICQIRSTNYEWITNETGITDFMDPKENMEASMFMLKNIEETYEPESIHQLLMMYNMGPTGAKNLFAQGIYSSKYSRYIVDYARNLGYEN